MKLLYSLLLLLVYTSSNAQCFPDRHSTNWFDAWISCEQRNNPNPTNPNSHWIMYDFGALYKLDAIKFWNINDPSHLDWGAKEILVEYSEDSINWKVLDKYNINKGSGHNRYEGETWEDIDIPRTRFVLLTILDNYDGTCSGLAELRFMGEKVKINTANVEEEPDHFLSAKARPNPFTDHLQITCESNLTGQLEYTIQTLVGQQITSGAVEISNGKQFLEFDTKQWASGSYLLLLKMDKQVYKTSLIKI